MFERFTASARRTVVLAQEEARSLHHTYIGTEHLLLALTLDRGPAGKALTGLGITHDAARTHVIEAVGEGTIPVSGHIPFLPAARSALMKALRIALDSGVNFIDSNHILLSLLAEDTSQVPVTEHTILSCGTTPAAVTERVIDLMTAPDAPVEQPETGFTLSA
ncbi:Clp protease N-terminal domain-containing protein [Pseudarthrobacter sp. BIM B-2242]|uniref:Clp protease N-terminal domain-containing protein n=1 Tax=Pseudarthrobacter sp. BIM B-2242 TaxID=2772401 RepID=UPI00168AE2FE|nr:Clp protease N-terminal domain-containing protein [Pseudarthrobacter sp. BIM B-2242]QOD06070.1 Clp protease [Pseudarthrobacter sp. BIM B-2242]